MDAPVKCLVMFSGGLDSTIAVHLLKSQGCEVIALHFVLPFESGLGIEHLAVVEYAGALGVELRIEEEGAEFLGMVKDPCFGYGKHANPCVDCRIHRLKKAAVIMKDTGARFLATGEVVGQRPMSQRRDSMITIEKQSGLKGYLLRPLSAAVLEPTIPEVNGWVDRSRLLGISGRGRKEQIAYAAKFGLKHGAPGGGCLLTQEEIGSRFMDLRRYSPEFSLNDFKALAYGRHFRINKDLMLVVGRDDRENRILEKLIIDMDARLQMADMEGPVAVLRGNAQEDDLKKCASIVARYSRARGNDSARVRILREKQEITLEVKPAADELCIALRV
jgi:tRNA U34 2-thiouridine synthase MnmA/TrmU